MQTAFLKRTIPWVMAAGRAALGSVLIAGAMCGWNGPDLATLVVTALLSDIFDGILARRWHSDTAALRLFDSMADTIFYLCTAVALWLRTPQIWRQYGWLLGALLALEALRFSIELSKYAKPASYHSYLAKAWGLLLAIAVIVVFATGEPNRLIPCALALGIASDLEGLAMSLMLRTWHNDVRTLAEAWRIRREELTAASSPSARRSRRLGAALLAVTVMAAIPVAVRAQSSIPATYVSGTNAVPHPSVGVLELGSASDLIFASPSPAFRLPIPYAAITNVHYRAEVTHHLGALPALLAAIVRSRERKHVFTIIYNGDADTPQVVVFEVPKDEPLLLCAALQARTSVIEHRGMCAPEPIQTR